MGNSNVYQFLNQLYTDDANYTRNTNMYVFLKKKLSTTKYKLLEFLCEHSQKILKTLTKN